MSYLGAFHYLHIGKPSLSIALDSLMAQHDYVSKLFTSFQLIFIGVFTILNSVHGHGAFIMRNAGLPFLRTLIHFLSKVF